MKNYLLPLLLSIMLFSGCNEDKGICNLPEDAQPIWVQDLIADLEGGAAYTYSFMMTGTYEGQQVFILKNCCPFCASAFPVFTCDGTEIGTIGSEINPNDIKDEEFYWAPPAVQCAIIGRGGLD